MSELLRALGLKPRLIAGHSAGAAVAALAPDPGRDDPVATRALVGRTRELAALDAALASALGGRRQLVFVTGEAGIGKTTLVEAFLAGAARRSSLRILRGQCVEQYGAGEPWLPLLDALGRLDLTHGRLTHGRFLRKPFSGDELRRVIRETLDA